MSNDELHTGYVAYHDNLADLKEAVSELLEDTNTDYRLEWSGLKRGITADDLLTNGTDSEYVAGETPDIDLQTGTYGEPMLQHHVAGSFVDVGAFVSGDPRCMLTVTPMGRQRNRVAIVVPTSARSSTTAGNLDRYGRTVAATILDYRDQGLEVDVYSALVCKDEQDDKAVVNIIKCFDSSDSYLIQHLMLATGSAVALRVLGFASQNMHYVPSGRGSEIKDMTAMIPQTLRAWIANHTNSDSAVVLPSLPAMRDWNRLSDTEYRQKLSDGIKVIGD